MPRLTPTILLLTPTLALAQPEDDPTPPTNKWSASAELLLWRPALQDDLTLPGVGSFEVDDFNLDENELTPALRATFTNDDWTIHLSGFVFSTDGIDSEADYASFEGLVTKRVWSRELSDEVSLRLDVGGGLRATDFRIEIPDAGMTVSEDSVWVEALAAATITVTLPNDFSFDINADIGAGLDSAAWSIAARVLWQPEPWLGAQFGYRFLRTDLDDDGFEFDGAIAGLYAGFNFDF